MMKIEIIYTPITGIVLGKEGPLKENTSDLMEQIGLKISYILNNNILERDNPHRTKKLKKSKDLYF